MRSDRRGTVTGVLNVTEGDVLFTSDSDSIKCSVSNVGDNSGVPARDGGDDGNGTCSGDNSTISCGNVGVNGNCL
jgi:hypothetical protein